MRKSTFVAVLLVCAVVAAIGFARAEDSPKPSPSSSSSVTPSPTPTPLPTLSPYKLDLKPGEKHSYEITWQNISGGTGDIKVMEKVKDADSTYYLLHMSASSSPLVSVFYKVEDLFVSRVDPKTGRALRFERHIREGKTYREETVDFDYAAQKAYYVQTKNIKNPPRKMEFPLPSSVLDPLSALFYLRGVDLQPGETVRLPMHSNEEDWALNLKVSAIVGLRVTGIGKFSAYKLMPQTKEDALFMAKGAMTVWVEKTTRVILKAEVNIPIGSVVIRLVRAENSPLETVNRAEKRRRWIRPGTKDIP
ncbi:MAG: DUF3108 domain-containing protein [Candidatus Brocadiia bacterium]